MSSLLVFNRVYRLEIHSVILVFSSNTHYTVYLTRFRTYKIALHTTPNKIYEGRDTAKPLYWSIFNKSRHASGLSENNMLVGVKITIFFAFVFYTVCSNV
jgi:hypothetical protein